MFSCDHAAEGLCSPYLFYCGFCLLMWTMLSSCSAIVLQPILELHIEQLWYTNYVIWVGQTDVPIPVCVKWLLPLLADGGAKKLGKLGSLSVGRCHENIKFQL